MPPMLTTAHGCPTWSARTTPAPGSGPIRPTGRRRTRRSSPRACSPVISTRRSHRAGRCPSASPEPMRSDPPCARRSSMSSPDKSTAWASSCALSASPALASRSAWRTLPITSGVSPGSRGVLRPHDTKTGSQSRLQAENRQTKRQRTGTTRPSRAVTSPSGRNQSVLRGVPLYRIPRRLPVAPFELRPRRRSEPSLRSSAPGAQILVRAQPRLIGLGGVSGT